MPQSTIKFLNEVQDNLINAKPTHFENIATKFREIAQFQRVLERTQETFEVTFDDEEAERQNQEVAQQLVDSPKFTTMLKGMLVLRELARIFAISCELSSLLTLKRESSLAKFREYQAQLDKLVDDFTDINGVFASHISVLKGELKISELSLHPCLVVPPCFVAE